MTAEKKTELTERQELFCQLFASDREFFGNGTQSYVEAYDIDLSEKGAYSVAGASASRLLKNVKITNRINEIFESRGLSDVFVDKQLEKLITQDADFKAKMQAIKEYNALQKRITKKVELGGTVRTGVSEKEASLLDKLNGLNEEQLESLLDEAEQEGEADAGTTDS